MVKVTKEDRVFSKIVRAEGVCQAALVKVPNTPDGCSPGPLQCCHIVTRTRTWTRTYEPNGVSMCGKHHHWFTEHPVEWGKWVVATFGEALYRDVYQRSLRTDKFDWDEEYVRLKARAKELGVWP